MNDQARDFFNLARPDRSRITFPDDVIFLCGGELGTSTRSIKSMRDYIWRNKDLICADNSVVLAEKAAQRFDSNLFDNLIEMERYIASVSRIVLLVCESAGSIAELGAFSQVREISKNLQVFVQSNHYSDNSFIRDGPLRQLEDNNEVSVQQFSWLTKTSSSIDVDSADRIRTAMAQAVRIFQRNQSRSEIFDAEKFGHRMLLVSGIVFMLRCCKLREIGVSLDQFGLTMNESEIRKHLFCLEILGWINVVKRDTKYYHYKLHLAPFQFGGVAPAMDPLRVRHDIGLAYDESDPRINVLREMEQE